MGDRFKSAAKQRGITVSKYMKENERAIQNLFDSGYTSNTRRPDEVIEIIERSNRKHITIEDQHGSQRLSKAEAIARIADLMQSVSSSISIAQIGIPIKVYESGRMAIVAPSVDVTKKEYKSSKKKGEIFEELSFEEYLMEVFDELGIEYFISE